jgi:hypothetical protein
MVTEDYNSEEEMLKFSMYFQIFSHNYHWYRREIRTYDFHEVIIELIRKHKPENLALLVLEYPHKSVKDPSNLAFTRDIRAGEDDRQTVTTFGRYIRRHFPQLKDHEIRDYTTKCNSDIFEVWDTIEGIIRSVQLGPKSCMTWDNQYTPGHPEYVEHKSRKHPYRVYDPSLGWRSVVRLRKEDNMIMGRALVLELSEENKGFVRTYKRGTDYSYADETLEYWLKEAGYEHWGEWPAKSKLKRIESDYGVLAPYLDGDIQTVDDNGEYLIITPYGNFELDTTDGYINLEEEDQAYCEYCDSHHDESYMVDTDDSYYPQVCHSCASNNFIQAVGYNGRTVFVQEEHTIYLESTGEHYFEDDIESNGIVQLQDGDYALVEDAIEHGITGDFYLLSDIEKADNTIIIGEYCYERDDTGVFYCEGSKEYYYNEASVEVDGLTYHVDYAPQKETENV